MLKSLAICLLLLQSLAMASDSIETKSSDSTLSYTKYFSTPYSILSTAQSFSSSALTNIEAHLYRNRTTYISAGLALSSFYFLKGADAQKIPPESGLCPQYIDFKDILTLENHTLRGNEGYPMALIEGRKLNNIERQIFETYYKKDALIDYLTKTFEIWDNTARLVMELKTYTEDTQQLVHDCAYVLSSDLAHNALMFVGFYLYPEDVPNFIQTSPDTSIF